MELANLPEEIVWEILIRLPPKSLISCRAVCRAWRSATSNLDFLLAHHDRQPTLPVVTLTELRHPYFGDKDILTFDHRAANDQLQPVVQLDGGYFSLA
jgi:hypothetical protein